MEGSTANYLNFRKITGTNLYRGSKSDNLGEADVENLERLGIKCLIDLRSPLEVGCAGIDAAVNHKFQPLELRGEKNSEFEFTEIKTKLKPSEKFAGEHPTDSVVMILSVQVDRSKLYVPGRLQASPPPPTSRATQFSCQWLVAEGAPGCNATEYLFTCLS